MARIRHAALRAIDRSTTARVAMARVLAAAYRRRGADRALLDEAVEGASTREAKRTAEMLMWSGAVAGVCSFPKWFPAAHHIQHPEGRRLSESALERYLADHPNAATNMWRQYFAFSEPEDLGDVQQFVQRDLDAQLRRTPVVQSGDRASLSSAGQLDILSRATSALESAGIRSFLVSGTLLGFVRDGQLMEHDYDIDLGVLPGESDAAAVGAALESAGFEVKVQDLKVVARDESDFAVDVFMHYERDGLLWHGTEIHEWWNTTFELKRADIQGVPVWMPDNAETYLKENYSTWERPVAFYHFSFDTPNRCYRQTHQALLYLHKRFVLALEMGDRWIAESAARELRDNFGVDVTSSLQPSGLLDGSDCGELA